MIPSADADYVCAMEAVLDVYERPFDEQHPVVAIDESPQQLVSEARAGFIDSKGVRYTDYEYRREGVADLYMICEPLAGRREILVKENHNRLNWAEVIRFVAEDAPPARASLTERTLHRRPTQGVTELLTPQRGRPPPRNGIRGRRGVSSARS